MSFIDYLLMIVAILGGHIISSLIIASAKKALGVTTKKEFK